MSKPASEIQCPACGYYCLGKGGFGCIDKPKLVEMEQKSNVQSNRQKIGSLPPNYSKGETMSKEYKPATCQYCLADANHTALGPDESHRCPVCGADYTGPRRDEEYRILLEAGLVAKDD